LSTSKLCFEIFSSTPDSQTFAINSFQGERRFPLTGLSKEQTTISILILNRKTPDARINPLLCKRLFNKQKRCTFSQRRSLKVDRQLAVPVCKKFHSFCKICAGGILFLILWFFFEVWFCFQEDVTSLTDRSQYAVSSSLSIL